MRTRAGPQAQIRLKSKYQDPNFVKQPNVNGLFPPFYFFCGPAKMRAKMRAGGLGPGSWESLV